MGDVGNAKDLVIPLLGALWGCTTIVFAVTKELNSIRDKVITGECGSQRYPLHLRKLWIQHDWLPLATCVVLVCFGFGIVSMMLPFVLKVTGVAAWITTLVVACYALAMGFFWIRTGCKDLKEMRDACTKCETDPKANAAGT